MTKITPHKGDNSGGRSERFNGRCTPRIKQLARDLKLSEADIFEWGVLVLTTRAGMLDENTPTASPQENHSIQ